MQFCNKKIQVHLKLDVINQQLKFQKKKGHNAAYRENIRTNIEIYLAFVEKMEHKYWLFFIDFETVPVFLINPFPHREKKKY